METMNLTTFKSTLIDATPPDTLGGPLAALWLDANCDWPAAHRAVQDDDSSDGAWVHAYLHRKEGDASNAAYWYRRAGKPISNGTLEEEWESMANALLNRG